MEIDYDYYMQKALEQAKKAYLEDEVPIGCVIVHNGQIIGKGGIEGMYSDAADPGHVWPIVRLQLADDEIVAKIHQADAGDARPVQSLPSQPGDGLSRHLLPTAVRYHYIRGDTIQEGVSIQQAGRSFLLQRDSPIRQVNPALIRGDIRPG